MWEESQFSLESWIPKIESSGRKKLRTKKIGISGGKEALQ